MSAPRALLLDAAARFREAGIASPEADARVLLAHVLGVSLGRLALVEDVGESERSAFAAYVERRVAREPLQHLTGVASFRYLDLAVGPGVFVPRPETELLAGWAVEAANRVVGEGRVPLVLDLGTGSGAIAASVATEVPTARVVAVEVDEAALEWAARNLTGTGVDLRPGDLATAGDDLAGRVDVVVSNPPYIPLEAWESVQSEARDHDPYLALFSGADGLDAIRTLADRAAAWLRPGGVLGFEHADAQGDSAPGVLVTHGGYDRILDHLDAAGRPRFVTARLAR